MNNQGMDLGFTTERIPECQHICMIYDNEEQRRKIVTAYLAAGIKEGNIVRYFADETSSEDIHAWLVEMGIELPQTEEDSFRIIEAEHAYCPSGRFVPQDVINNAVSRYAAARVAGYSGSRVCGEMTWALRDIPGSERILEYEIGLNAINDTFPRVGMCQYDARRFDGAMLYKVLQVHPFIIAKGQIVRNPFYITPGEANLK
ncbi:MAG: hypothetical protein C4583_15135 [Anaerolineaceae bacterium]|nr:MAG: hypothetical protein C4583_15135 [Anaerolineaceae bacterium]